jgi:tetratricopeptide (TPR) repeat protein
VQIAGAAPWFYLAKILLPVGLSPAYPRWEVGAGRLLWWLPLLATLSVALVFLRALPALRSSAARTAWLLGLAGLLLAPSLGVVAFANLSVTSVSDHFLYVPSPALFGEIALGAGRVPRIAKGAAVLICAALSVAYAPVFRDAESLWTRVVEADPDSYAGNLGLAEAWSEKGRFADALPRYERALAIEPLAADAYLLLGKRKSEQGDAAGAAALFARASELSPGSAPARLGLAAAQERLGHVEDALLEFERAARLAPRDTSARMELGRIYLAFARPADALPEFQAVLHASPGHPRAALGAATSLRSLARHEEAVTVLHASLERNPEDVRLLNLLALTLATSSDARVRNGSEAVRLAERAVARSGDPELRATLAAAYAEAGRYDEALTASRRAEAEAAAAGNTRGAAEYRRRAELYARGEPLRL